MKLFRTLFFATLGLALAVSTSFAQHQRMVLFEEFTAMTCPPCAAVKPYVEEFAATTPNVITVTYHQNYPAPGDPYNMLDNSLNRTRHDWYGVTGIPAGFMNGVSTYPSSVAVLKAAAAKELAKTSPLLITVTEDRSSTPIKVNIKIKNDGTTAITGVSLHTQVINYYADLSTYPDVVNNANTRYKQFDYCIMKAIPTITGAAISIAAGEEKSVDYTYSIGSNTTLWNTPYVIAFVQNMSTKEVLQAGTDFASVAKKVTIESTENQFMMVARGKSVKKTITLKNENPASMTVALDFIATPTIPADWSAPAFSNQSVAVPGKGTATVDVTFNTGNNGGSFFTTVKATPQGGGLNIESTYDFGYVADNTKYCVLAGYSTGGLSDAYVSLNGNAKYKNEVAYVPAMRTVIDQLGVLPFSAFVAPVDFAHRGSFVNDEYAGIVSELFNSGKRMLFFGDAALYNAMKVTTAPQGWNNFFQNIGLTGLQADPAARFTGTPAVPKAYNVRGVAKDAVGDGILLPVNSSSTMFNYYTEDIAFDATVNNMTPFLYYDSNTGTNAGVRFQSESSRGIILGFNVEAIASSAARSVFYGKMMDWLTAEITVVKTPDIKITGTSGETVELGTVEVGKTKDATAELKNTGTADLIITGIEIAPEYKDVLTWKTADQLPITIAPGDKKILTISFKPTKADDIITYCTIKSNAKSASVDGENIFGINATAATSSSVDEGTSGDRVVSVSAAPNPVNGMATIKYNVGGTLSQVVTVSIVDALGNTVATLANGSMSPGSYVAQFDANTVAAGSYKVVVNAGSSRTFAPVVVIK